MADTYTKIADLIDPEVMGDMVSARIPKKLRMQHCRRAIAAAPACWMPAAPAVLPITPVF